MKKHITLIGMGCGPLGVTAAGMIAIENAQLIIGSERMIEILPEVSARVVTELHTHEIYQVISEASEEKIAVLFSGDVGFYSGAEKLYEMLLDGDEDHKVDLIAGVSVLQYLAARLGLSWQDIKVISAHGRDIDPVKYAFTGKKVLFLTSSAEGLHEICAKLCDASFENKRVVVAERLGYEDENIIYCLVSEARDMPVDDLNVLLVG
ncbi:MAG: precorrin-6y C5,15-methyltransferase (decarboxylating) subunit CbiE [Lachnospiraceae bacterium]|nr:precorrin-6y C5,15-methyltransferase (decarboxylating) subunit CbiE [Lachnospiraceae bacterium]